MTEEEAKTKWCPFVRFHSTPLDTHAPNRSGGMSDTTRCLGSGCMAWRWISNGDVRSKIEAIRDHRALHGSTLHAAKAAVEATWCEPKERGYCGLAGAPQ